MTIVTHWKMIILWLIFNLNEIKSRLSILRFELWLCISIVLFNCSTSPNSPNSLQYSNWVSCSICNNSPNYFNCSNYLDYYNWHNYLDPGWSMYVFCWLKFYQKELLIEIKRIRKVHIIFDSIVEKKLMTVDTCKNGEI